MALRELSGSSHPFHLGHHRDLGAGMAGAKILWVTSNGGHLSELSKIEENIASAEDSLWVTAGTPQSVSYLVGRRSLLVDYVSPRDAVGALRVARRVAPFLRREHFDFCMSTGAALAAAVLPLAALHGIPTYYIESVTRTRAPSLTGRLMARAPRVQTLTQYEQWSSRTWPFAGSLLDGWVATGGPVPERPLKILVTLGTIRPYRFDRAVAAVLAVLAEGDEVVWQLGATTRDDLPGDVHVEMGAQRLTELARQADVVVAHAGVGSMLHLFEQGISPVVAVRCEQHAEHVDDHQRGLAETTAARGLTTTLDLTTPSRATLLLAAGRVITSRPAFDPPDDTPSRARKATK